MFELLLLIAMEKFLIDQRQLHSKTARILEINPEHNIWKKVSSSLQDNQEEETNNNLVHVVYSESCLIEGDNIENPSEFSGKLNSLLAKIK